MYDHSIIVYCIIIKPLYLILYDYYTIIFYYLCRQWREEREKLIQCIHLQQLELSQRSIAAHERAIDIAKVIYIYI